MKALLIIDVQNDYFPGGKCELSGPEKALGNIVSVLRLFRKAGLPVIHVQHVNTRPDATFFLPDGGMPPKICCCPRTVFWPWPSRRAISAIGAGNSRLQGNRP